MSSSSAHSIALISPASQHKQRQKRHSLTTMSMPMNGGLLPSNHVGVCATRRLPSVLSSEQAIAELKLVASSLEAQTQSCDAGILRIEVPVRQRVDAIHWLHAQQQQNLIEPSFYFASRARHGMEEDELISVAGVGAAVGFQGKNEFGYNEWRSIKRFLSKDCPLIRAYGAIRFDASTSASAEWKDFGSHFFTIPQVEFDELQESSMLAINVAWDNNNFLTWKKAIDKLKDTLHKISPCFSQVRMSRTTSGIVSCQHFPSKESWYGSIERALQMIKGNNSELKKVVLARCSNYITNNFVDPLVLLTCLKEESRSSYQFCIQPPNAASFIGNTPEQLFHRKSSIILSEALAGTRARGQTYLEDLHIGQDLLLSYKDGSEFAVVRDNIRQKLETVCGEVFIEPIKALRKLPRVQHLSAKLSGKLRNEDDEFEIMMSLHPTPAVCGLPTEDARQFIQESELFDRGMYAGPVGWFGGRESEFAVGIRSALVAKDCRILVYSGAGIVEGTDPSLEWEELNLKASQFTRLLQYHEHHVCCQGTKGKWTTS